MQEYLPTLLKGATVTAGITLLSLVAALALAFAAGMAAVSHRRLLRAGARVYVELFRGTSLLVQLFWMYYALPLLGVSLTAFSTGVLTLGLHFGAYGAEIVRGAIRSVPEEQSEAAVALNFTSMHRLWRIILPQAVPAMVPPFGNNAIELLKGSALVSLITIHDLTFKGQLLRNLTYESGRIFALVLVMYFLMSLCLTMVVRGVERAVRLPGMRPAGL